MIFREMVEYSNGCIPPEVHRRTEKALKNVACGSQQQNHTAHPTLSPGSGLTSAAVRGARNLRRVHQAGIFLFRGVTNLHV